MKIVSFIFILVGLLLPVENIGAGCDQFASCPVDGENSTQTGRIKYTPNGCVIAEYAHSGSLDGKRPGHKFWEACECQ